MTFTGPCCQQSYHSTSSRPIGLRVGVRPTSNIPSRDWYAGTPSRVVPFGPQLCKRSNSVQPQRNGDQRGQDQLQRDISSGCNAGCIMHISFPSRVFSTHLLLSSACKRRRSTAEVLTPPLGPSAGRPPRLLIKTNNTYSSRAAFPSQRSGIVHCLISHNSCYLALLS